MSLVVKADASRPAIRLPLVLLVVICLCSVAVLLVGAAYQGNPHWHNASQASLRIAAVCAAVACYLRFIYVPRTRLVMDDGCIAVSQPLSTWQVAWADVESLTETGWLTPTHRGGIGAGVRLKLRSGKSLHISDVFEIDRKQLACKLKSEPDPQ